MDKNTFPYQTRTAVKIVLNMDRQTHSWLTQNTIFTLHEMKLELWVKWQNISLVTHL